MLVYKYFKINSEVLIANKRILEIMKKLIFTRFKEKDERRIKKYDSERVVNKMVFSTNNEKELKKLILSNQGNLSKINRSSAVIRKENELVKLKFVLISEEGKSYINNLSDINTRNKPTRLIGSNIILPSIETYSPYLNSESNRSSKEKFQKSENTLFKLFTTPDASKASVMSDVFPKFESMNKL
jgi:hypothetical protein